MRDPLDYSEAELRELSIEELRSLYNKSTDNALRYNVGQNTEKVLINGLYGALANKWFPLFNEKMAQAITANGRYFIRLLANNIEEVLQSLKSSEKPYIVGGDTDSVYFQIAPFVQDFIDAKPDSTLDDQVNFADAFEKKVISRVIQDTIDTLARRCNANNREIIGVEREGISDTGIFLAKKKYILRVRDNEGHRYPEHSPYIKVMGLELAKGGTPEWSKKYLKEAIPVILDKEESELRSWLREVKKEYINSDISDIVISAGVNNLDYVLGEKGVPIGARSALVHNLYIKDNELDDIYTAIDAGERTKRVYLQEPNKFNSNIIAFIDDSFAKELDCIDWDTQFEKGFLNPLENMIKGLNYNIQQETATLDDW